MLGGIGIGDAQIFENVAFQGLHLLGLFVFHMVMAKKMQHAMHDKMGEMVGEALVLLHGFARNGFAGEHHIAKQGALFGQKGLAASPGISMEGKESTLVGASLPR